MTAAESIANCDSHRWVLDSAGATGHRHRWVHCADCPAFYNGHPHDFPGIEYPPCTGVAARLRSEDQAKVGMPQPLPVVGELF